MLGRKRIEVSVDLARAADRFAAWRQNRARGARIPECLWSVAVECANLHGLSRTATVLKVGYYELRKHQGQRNPSLGCDPSSPTFVELPSVSVAVSGSCVIEWEKDCGERMRVQLSGGACPDLLSLSRSFWESR